MSPAPTRTLDLADADVTAQFGAAIGRALQRPCNIWLEGELGAGKTTLVRGLLRALGHAGSVKSPTYTLVEPYEFAAGTVYHLDLYRLADPEELEFLGVRELDAGLSVVLVEWPERGAGFLSPPDLVLTLSVYGDGRRAVIEARSRRGEEMLTHLELPA